MKIHIHISISIACVRVRRRSQTIVDVSSRDIQHIPGQFDDWSRFSYNPRASQLSWPTACSIPAFDMQDHQSCIYRIMIYEQDAQQFDISSTIGHSAKGTHKHVHQTWTVS